MKERLIKERKRLVEEAYNIITPEDLPKTKYYDLEKLCKVQKHGAKLYKKNFVIVDSISHVLKDNFDFNHQYPTKKEYYEELYYYGTSKNILGFHQLLIETKKRNLHLWDLIKERFNESEVKGIVEINEIDLENDLKDGFFNFDMNEIKEHLFSIERKYDSEVA